MAVVSRTGVVTIHVDGHWDIEDLLALSESLAESYGYFYVLIGSDDEQATEKLHDTVRAQFWTGELAVRRFGRFLYRSVPEGDRLKIKSFHLASPGALELVAVLPALWMAARVGASLDISWLRFHGPLGEDRQVLRKA